ncbi:MAG TPA: hypothetical protein VFA92_10085 [Candidatus Binatia bacterium]|jgi:hypothetical protein|nr:hypothetical protein [Candidatus Binatia bacterium]
MRTLIRLEIPAEAGNAAIKDGRLQQTLERAMEELKPEAAYFGAINGQRGGFLVIDLADVTDMPSVAERFFELGATVEMCPAMTAEDVAVGLEKLEPAQAAASTVS